MVSFTIVKFTSSMELPRMVEVKLQNDDEEAVLENFLGYKITISKIKEKKHGKEKKSNEE